VTFTASATVTTTVHEGITATYGGDSAHTGSNGSTTVTIAVTVQPTTTSVSCTGPVVINQASTCTATVMSIVTSGATTPTGTVSFSATGTATGSFTGSPCTLSGSGATATCTATFTASASGSASVMATYNNDSTHSSSSGSTSITVNKRSTMTRIGCTFPLSVGQSATCLVNVTDTDVGTPIVPTGTVTVSSDAALLSSSLSCALSGGSCTVTFTAPAGSGGSHIVTASYGGDAVHLTSSGTTTLVVNDFTISVSPTTANIFAGRSGSFTVSLTSLGGFTGSITLSTSALPTGFTDGFVPNPVTIATAGNTNTSNLTIAVPTGFTGTVTFNVTGTSGSLSHTSVTLTINVSPQPVPIFSAGKLHWTHHLSVSKTGSMQTYTAIVSNPQTNSVSVLVHITGTSQTNPSLTFDIMCGVTCVDTGGAVTPVTVAAGASLSFSFSQSITSGSVGNKFSFTAVLLWGPVGSTPSITSNSKSGAFAVVA